MASVSCTPSGFEVRAYAGRDAVTGSVRNLYRRLPATAHEAELEQAKAELQALADRFKGTGEPFTLQGMLEFYFQRLEADHSPTYIDGLRSNARRHLYPALGSRRIDTIRPYELLDVYSNMVAPPERGGKGLSPNTARKLNAWLSCAFNELRAMSIMADNPLEGLRPIKAKAYEAAPLTEADLRKLTNYLRVACGKEEPYELDLALWLCLNTGLRAGELAGLHASDVSPIRKRVTVAWSLARAKGKGLFYKEPKGGRVRHVTLGDSTMAMAARAAAMARARDPAHEPPLFCGPDGLPHDPKHFNAHLKRVCEQIGIGKYAHLHTLRHTHATYLLLKGVPIRVVQERLGHADVTTTLKVYGHVLPSCDEQAALAFDQILGSIQ